MLAEPRFSLCHTIEKRDKSSKKHLHALSSGTSILPLRRFISTNDKRQRRQGLLLKVCIVVGTRESIKHRHRSMPVGFPRENRSTH